MSRRASAAVGLGLVLGIASSGFASAGSVVATSELRHYTVISGTGCGSPASVSIPLPPSAMDVEVRQPSVGTKTAESRLIEATVAGASVRLTAVGEGAAICDPAADPDIPPAERSWSGTYDYEIAYREEVSVRYWAGAGNRPRQPQTRPAAVTMPLVARVEKIRWRSFGGRRAVGYGRARSLAPPGIRCDRQTCPGNGRRVKVVLTRPWRCADIGDAVYYGRWKFYPRGGHVLSPGEATNPDYEPTCSSEGGPL